MSTPLRRLAPSDHQELIAVYREAVLSQAPGLYNPEQVRAWAHHAAQNPAVLAGLSEGYGLASVSDPACAGLQSIEAFGLLDPPEAGRCRLALLYCRGRASRQGRGGAILAGLEHWARQQGCDQLHTEASQLSRPLLERRGWLVAQEERLIFAGEPFVRWRMIKTLS